MAQTFSRSLLYAAMSTTMDIIYIVLSALGLFLNLFTVIIICLHKPMHKHLTNAFVINQSLIDIVASVMVLSVTIFQYEGAKLEAGNPVDKILCRVLLPQAPMYGMLISSNYGIVALTFERYLAVVHPFWHRAHFSGWKVAIIFAFV